MHARVESGFNLYLLVISDPVLPMQNFHDNLSQIKDCREFHLGSIEDELSVYTEIVALICCGSTLYRNQKRKEFVEG